MNTMTSLTNKYFNLYTKIMSDTITKWHEMQVLSDQGGKYTVPKKGGEAIPYHQKPVPHEAEKGQ